MDTLELIHQILENGNFALKLEGETSYEKEKNMKWTYYETLILEEHMGTDKELFERLQAMGAKHSFAAVRKMRQRKGITKHGGRPQQKVDINDNSSP